MFSEAVYLRPMDLAPGAITAPNCAGTDRFLMQWGDSPMPGVNSYEYCQHAKGLHQVCGLRAMQTCVCHTAALCARHLPCVPVPCLPVCRSLAAPWLQTCSRSTTNRARKTLHLSQRRSTLARVALCSASLSTFPRRR